MAIFGILCESGEDKFASHLTAKRIETNSVDGPTIQPLHEFIEPGTFAVDIGSGLLTQTEVSPVNSLALVMSG